MWLRVIAAVALLFVATFVIQILISRRGARNFLSSQRARGLAARQYAMWDVAPVAGFFGAILLALSFAEAARREAIDGWRWGIAFGLILSGCLGAAAAYRWKHRAPRKETAAQPGVAPRPARDPAGSAIHVILGFVRTYGLVLLFAILGVTLAVRIVGAALQVFIAGALGTFTIALAVALFAIAWRYKSVRSRQ